MTPQFYDRKVSGKTYLLEFVPESIYTQLSDKKKVLFRGKLLKVDCIFHLINSIVTRYYFSESAKMNISSEITRQWYGAFYNYYMDYLVHIGFIKVSSKYFKGLKCNTYQLCDLSMLESVIRRKDHDKTILKKWKNHFLMNKVRKQEHTRINREVKYKLVQDFLHVKVKFKEATAFLEDSYKNNIIGEESFKKNKLSVECIHDGSLFHTEDEYGRFHTNLTVLKREIRNNYLTIDGEEVSECDIVNSQPFFLSAYLKRSGFDKLQPEEYALYDSQVRGGTIYDQIAGVFNCCRDKAKKIMYLVMFGKSNMAMEAHQQFYNLYPTIWQYIANLKTESGNHKVLAHELQRMESEVIYNRICYRIQREHPHVRLFTVHDSLFFGKKYKQEVETIFHEELAKI